MPTKAALTAQLTRIMFPFIVLVSLAALVMGMLNAKSVFGRPAMASSFFNLGSIIGGVTLGAWIDPHFGPRALIGLAIGTLIGGALQFAVQLPPLEASRLSLSAGFSMARRGVSAILALMGPSVIAASTTQFNVLINSMFASTLGDGAIFWLAIAFRLMQLPLGLFGVALGTVTLPLLSRLVVAGQMTAFRAELARAMRLMFLLTIPSTIGLMMLAEPIISVLYQHGKFDAYEAAQAAGALRFYAVWACGLRRAQGAGERVLCARPAQNADAREFPRRRAQSALQLDIHFSAGLGPPRPRLLDRLRGDLQFSDSVRVDAAPPRAASSRGALLRALGKSRGRRRGAGRSLRRLVALAAGRMGHAVLSGARPSRCSGPCWWAVLVFSACGALLGIEELDELIAGLKRRLQRAR